jgi:hypothetical protein
MPVASELESQRSRRGGLLSQDQFRRELAMAAELVASGHGDALLRCGVAWLPARTVVELFSHGQTCQGLSQDQCQKQRYADIP